MNLKILTWNIAFGYGKHSEGGPGYKKKPRSYFESRLNKISDFISDLDPDVVLLQEVDFESARSHYIDELDWISRRTGLYYRSKVVSWQHPFVPYPGINPLQFFGRIDSGGGIISKYPLTEIKNILLPKPKENSKLYNLFYLSRYLQLVQLEAPQGILKIGNVHLEAFSKENRMLHLLKLQDALAEHQLDLVGGDFNGEILLNLNEYKNLPTPEPTYPADRPKDFLDGWMIRAQRFKVLQHKTLHSGILSDHFPLFLELDF